ncbi:hypothetical protein ABEV20_03955 [Bhargavaea massiliensis]
MQQTLKQKIEWMLNDGFLTNKGNKDFAYGIDLETNTFYAISRRAVRAKKPKRILEETELPLADINENMEILKF